jgi:hypothetical protein
MLTWIKRQSAQPSTYRGGALLIASILSAVFGQPLEAPVMASVDGLAAAVTASVGLYDVLRNGRPFGSPGA